MQATLGSLRKASPLLTPYRAIANRWQTFLTKSRLISTGNVIFFRIYKIKKLTLVKIKKMKVKILFTILLSLTHVFANSKVTHLHNYLDSNNLTVRLTNGTNLTCSNDNKHIYIDSHGTVRGYKSSIKNIFLVYLYSK